MLIRALMCVVWLRTELHYLVLGHRLVYLQEKLRSDISISEKIALTQKIKTNICGCLKFAGMHVRPLYRRLVRTAYAFFIISKLLGQLSCEGLAVDHRLMAFQHATAASDLPCRESVIRRLLLDMGHPDPTYSGVLSDVRTTTTVGTQERVPTWLYQLQMRSDEKRSYDYSGHSRGGLRVVSDYN